MCEQQSEEIDSAQIGVWNPQTFSLESMLPNRISLLSSNLRQGFLTKPYLCLLTFITGQI